MKNLDLVISVDTAPCHLAGAMNIPTWILLPYPSDWRWLRNRTDSVWYPSVQLFKQPKTGDWESVIQEVVTALRQKLSVPNKKNIRKRMTLKHHVQKLPQTPEFKDEQLLMQLD